MVDNRIEEEYHFVEENASSDERSAFSDQVASSKSSFFERINRKTLLIITVILLIGGGAIYGGINFWNNTNVKFMGVDPSKISVAAVIVTPPVKSPSTSKPVALESARVKESANKRSSIATPASNVPIAPKEKDQSVSNKAYIELQEVVTDNTNNIQELNSQLNDLQKTLSDLNDKLNNVDNKIQKLSTSIATINKHRTTTVVKKSKPINKVTITYYIKAMVPGRVWLTSSTGSNLTLALGDNLQGYGTIMAINVEQGIIETSSGAIISYSPSDR